MSARPDPSSAPEPLDASLRALLDDVRLCDETDPAFDEQARTRVRAGVERALAEPPAKDRSGLRLRSGVMIASVCLLAAFATSRIIEGRSGSHAPTSVSAPRAFTEAPAEQAASAPPLGDDVPTRHVDELPTSVPKSARPRPAPLPRAEAANAPAAAPTGSDLAEEYRLVDGARAKLTAKDHAGALGMIREHDERFPNGQLAQECESLHIQALVETGRIAEARERAHRFRTRFPNGLLLPSVTRAIASSSPDPASP